MRNPSKVRGTAVLLNIGLQPAAGARFFGVPGKRTYCALATAEAER